MSGTEVASAAFTKTEFLIDPIIPKEGITFLYGKYGAFKTAIGMNIAKAIACQPDLWGLPVVNTRVLVVEGDTPRSGIIPRIKQIDPDVPNLDFAFVYPGIDIVNQHTPVENAIFINHLRKKHAENKYGFVLIDSLRSSHPLSDKDSEAATLIYRLLAGLFPGALVFVIHHDKKSKPIEKHLIGTGLEEELEDESFSGSQAWINHATTSLKIKKQHGHDKNWVTVKQTKSQVGLIAPAIDIQVAEGMIITLAATLTMERMREALHSVSWKTLRELDERLATYFDVSARWARTHRIEYEREVEPIPRVGPMGG